MIKQLSNKLRVAAAVAVLALSPVALSAQTDVNLTPWPAAITQTEGTLTLPRTLTIGGEALPASFSAELSRFAQTLTATTAGSVKAKLTNKKPFVRVGVDPALGAEAYHLSITTGGIEITAAQSAGLFYALQSIKKMLPANVMAGTVGASGAKYALPLVCIDDAPRYSYRAFMLDVSRHFFSVEEVKRIIDLMAAYKMNAFHWHLTDDQGWRVEIKKWPKLTSVGSIAPNVRLTDIKKHEYVWTGKPYGPHFYTQEQLRDVVAYAAERHIDIIPEIDMPGHFVAAMAAYPEFSCWPEGKHEVWTDGGISTDVLNVGNPAAVSFAKDILKEIIDIFPSKIIHIGGDECPTNAWAGNAQCQALKQQLGLENDRELQSNFMREVGEFIRQNGREVAVWNEAITARGADTRMIQSLDATVFCWIGWNQAAKKAQELGLRYVWTPQIPYYINRKQRPDDLNAGDGSDNLERVYLHVPNAEAVGVQGTFWTEHVSEPEHLELQALPRLMAVAEAGWTPQSARRFAPFIRRIAADSTFLQLGGYNFNADYMTPAAFEKAEREGK